MIRLSVLAVYSRSDAIETMLVALAWLAFLVVGLWLLVAAIRNRNVSWWVKVLLALLVLIFPPLGFLGCLAFWIDARKSRYRTVWEGATQHDVIVGPAEVHRLDGSVVIVEAGQRYEP